MGQSCSKKGVYCIMYEPALVRPEQSNSQKEKPSLYKTTAERVSLVIFSPKLPKIILCVKKKPFVDVCLSSFTNIVFAAIWDDKVVR